MAQIVQHRLLLLLFALLLGITFSHAAPLDSRGTSAFTVLHHSDILTLYAGCNAACQNNRLHHSSPHPGTLTISGYDPDSRPCQSDPTEATCTIGTSGGLLILVEGNSFAANDGVSVVMRRKSDNKALWSGSTYTGNFGSFGLKTSMRDCSNVAGATKNNAYVVAWDARSSKWGKVVDVYTGCTQTTL
jgi:hypothetical protein